MNVREPKAIRMHLEQQEKRGRRIRFMENQRAIREAAAARRAGAAVAPFSEVSDATSST